MTEEEARDWVRGRSSASAFRKLERFGEILICAAAQQNLISTSTLPQLWTRHLVDCAQLVQHAPATTGHWVDIGSGAGLPGLVVAILADIRMTLIEPRRLRTGFLSQAAQDLELTNVTIVQVKAQSADVATADVISARAVAKLDQLLAASRGFATRSTTFILPKGESAQSEVATARRSWHGRFHVEQSIVDPKSGIVIATGVTPR